MEQINNEREGKVNKRKRDKTHVKSNALGSLWIKFIKPNLLVFFMMFGVLGGVTVGLGLNSSKLAQPQIVYLRLPGDLFVQSMKMLMIPIIVSSLFCSTAEIDIRSSGKIGLRTLVYYIATLVLASTLGITLAITIQPGERAGQPVQNYAMQSLLVSSNPGLAIMDLLRNMIADNLIAACITSKVTKEIVEPHSQDENSTNNSNVDVIREVTANNVGNKLVTEKVDGANMIGIVTISILFGCVTSVVGLEARPLVDLFQAIRVISYRLVRVFLWYSPVGIASLVAAKLAPMENPEKAFFDLGLLVVTNLVGLVMHGFLVLPAIYFVIVRRNPFKFVAGGTPALIFAFASESSNATLPLTIQCLEDKNKVDPRVTRLVSSVGATVNMDGTSLSMPLVMVFVAQLNNIPLSAGQLIIICLLGVSCATGVGGVPGTSSVFTVMILASIGLPTDDLGTLFAVDWLLGRSRTTINVIGDIYGAGIIEHLSRGDLRKSSRAESKNINKSTLLLDEESPLDV